MSSIVISQIRTLALQDLQLGVFETCFLEVRRTDIILDQEIDIVKNHEVVILFFYSVFKKIGFEHP